MLLHGHHPFERLFERYGDVVSLRVPWVIPGVSRVVFFRDPALLKTVFSASYEQLSNDGNLPIVGLYGTRSMVLLDGPPHLRLRRLALPPLRGGALEEWRTLMTEVARREARSVPTDQPVRLHPRLLRAGLEIILRIVLGVEGDQLATWIPPMTELLEMAVSEQFGFRYMLRHTGAFTHWPRFRRVLSTCNELVYAEISRRRKDPDHRKSDVMDLLLNADGEPLTDQEIRDQIITLLVAGHETTATAVSWAIERLIRHPQALAAATAEALDESAGTKYAEAVVHETLRLRPTIAFFGRVTRTTFRLGAYDIPPNTLLVPDIRGIHKSSTLYEAPDKFRPERFLEKRPGTYDLIPFGAGAHRCLGDRLAIFQSTIFLQTFLRELVLRPVDPRGERVKRKAIVYTPSHGATVYAQRRTAKRANADAHAEQEPTQSSRNVGV
jgi:cytochrome P450